MHFLDYFSRKTLKYDGLNTFDYQEKAQLPQIKKIILHFCCNNANVKQLSSSMLALELFTTKKGRLTTTTKINVLLKIKKGTPAGCKVILTKGSIYIFLTRFLNEIWPLISTSKKMVNTSRRVSHLAGENKNYYYWIEDALTFLELEENFHLFNLLGHIDMYILANSKTKYDIPFICNWFQLPKGSN